MQPVDQSGAEGCGALLKDKGKHLVYSLKPSTKRRWHTMRELERGRFEVTYLDGGKLRRSISRNSRRHEARYDLVSVMYVNNEIGVIQDIAAIAE